MKILVNRLRQEGHEAVAVSTNLGICAAVLAAVCISAAPAPDAAGGRSGVTLVHDKRGSFSSVCAESTPAFTDVTVREALMRATLHEIDQQASGSATVGSAAVLSLSGRALQIQAGTAPRRQQGRGVRALLRAIQTIFHLARTACLAMVERLSLSAAPRRRTLASVSLANRGALTVRAGGSDAV
ncbi:hypothetical protein FHP25_30255 [Vineibacter terrae]|uniref:Uncharacterized protein n=1 Tax=Vineibacter terrae TaxID=2586908 RepID=A0A5C8PE02_9HYPH|nr:hypothetical protein [Vineibacter terrae]TXL71376.1 hypothetical protein FHP25_30255 [Vineibacter terrae]